MTADNRCSSGIPVGTCAPAPLAATAAPLLRTRPADTAPGHTTRAERWLGIFCKAPCSPVGQGLVQCNQPPGTTGSSDMLLPLQPRMGCRGAAHPYPVVCGAPWLLSGHGGQYHVRLITTALNSSLLQKHSTHPHKTIHAMTNKHNPTCVRGSETPVLHMLPTPVDVASAQEPPPRTAEAARGGDPRHPSHHNLRQAHQARRLFSQDSLALLEVPRRTLFAATARFAGDPRT